MAFKVQLIVENEKGLETFIKAKEAQIIAGIKEFGQIALDELANQISMGSKRQGKTGKLAGELKKQGIDFSYDPIFHRAEVGVGNYLNLSANRNSVYFYVLDFGVTFGDNKKFVPPIPPRGSFQGNAPNSSMKGTGTDAWKKDGWYQMTPTTFRPINYSSKANFILQNRWDVFWNFFIKN